MKRTPTVLVLDDSEICLSIAREALMAARYNVITTTKAIGFSGLVHRTKPDVVLIDVNMPALTGDALASILVRGNIHRCPVLLHSDRPEHELQGMVKESGASGFVRKTPSGAGLADAVRRALPQAR